MTTKLKGKLDFGNTTINYSVIKTKRRKTSEIIVDKDTVEIRAPFDKPDEEIRNIVKDKANWILKKQDEYRKMNSEITKLTFGENSTLPYLGKNYPLRIFNREARNSISFADGQFIVNIWPSKNVTAQYVEKLYEHWLMKIAHPIFKNKIESYSEKLDVGTSIVPIESDSTRIFFDTNLQSISYILDFCVPNNPIDQYTQRVQKS